MEYATHPAAYRHLCAGSSIRDPFRESQQRLTAAAFAVCLPGSCRTGSHPISDVPHGEGSKQRQNFPTSPKSGLTCAMTPPQPCSQPHAISCRGRATGFHFRGFAQSVAFGAGTRRIMSVFADDSGCRTCRLCHLRLDRAAIRRVELRSPRSGQPLRGLTCRVRLGRGAA